MLPIATLVLAVSAAAAASPEDGLPAPGAALDTTQVFATRHHYLLSFPRLLWTWMVYPVGQAATYAEHERLPRRVLEAFTNQAGTFGVFPQVQLGGETETGAAARLFHTDLFGGGQSVEAFYVFSGTERQRAEVFYRDPHLGTGGWFWEVGGEYLATDHEDATVNGVVDGRQDLRAQITTADSKGLFEQRRLDARVGLGWRSHAGPLEDYRAGFTAEVRVGWARRDLEALAEVPDLRGATSTAAASRVPGLGRQPTYRWVGIRLAWDDRDAVPPQKTLSHSLRHHFPGRVLLEYGGLYHSFRNIHYPEGGGLAEVSFDVASGSDDVGFARLGAEVQRFHTLFWRERVLAARARLDKVFPGDDGIVPYEDLPTLGGGQRLRGYHRGSFRGEGALLLAVEYRWPVWDTWNASLFWEEGQVFDDFGDLEADGFASSVGTGLTVRTETAFLLRLHAAHGKGQGVLLGLGLEQEF